MLWWFTVCFSILQGLLTLGVAHWLRRWALWSSTCPTSGNGLSPICCQPSCLSGHLFTDSSHKDMLLAPPRFSSALSVFPPPLLCCSFQFVVYCSVFVFVAGGQSAQGPVLVYPEDGWGNTAWCLVLTCLICWMSSKQVWSQHLAAVAALLFSQDVTWYGEAFHGLEVQFWSFDFPWCFIFSKCGSSISVGFLIHRAHTVCFCTLVTILDPSI
jgi:hypothetical protein